jgi:hypothetical protein
MKVGTAVSVAEGGVAVIARTGVGGSGVSSSFPPTVGSAHVSVVVGVRDCGCAIIVERASNVALWASTRGIAVVVGCGVGEPFGKCAVGVIGGAGPSSSNRIAAPHANAATTRTPADVASASVRYGPHAAASNVTDISHEMAPILIRRSYAGRGHEAASQLPSREYSFRCLTAHPTMALNDPHNPDAL